MRIWFRALVSGCALTALAHCATPAIADSDSPDRCDLYDAQAEHLAREYGESVAVRLPTDGAGVVEVWISPEGTWTVLQRRGPFSCVVDAGESAEFPTDSEEDLAGRPPPERKSEPSI